MIRLGMFYNDYSKTVEDRFRVKYSNWSVKLSFLISQKLLWVSKTKKKLVLRYFKKFL